MNTRNGKCLTPCKDYPNCKPCPQIEADEYLNSKNLFDSTDGKDVITTNFTGLKAILIDFLQRQGHKTEKINFASITGELLGTLKGILIYDCIPSDVKERVKARIEELETKNNQNKL